MWVMLQLVNVSNVVNVANVFAVNAVKEGNVVNEAIG